MIRLTSHYLFCGSLLRLSYVELDAAGNYLGVFPLDGEMACTSFYNGLLLLLPARLYPLWADVWRQVQGEAFDTYPALAGRLGGCFPAWELRRGEPVRILHLTLQPFAASELGTYDGSRDGHVE